ncbi:MAG: glycoside hydrolase family 55 protein, partial [Cytophagales bacterium]|nr:glycoside hydrolase family 55 protein [Cytophagales bacterium]
MKKRSRIRQVNCKHATRYGSWIVLLLCLGILIPSVNAQVPFRETGMVNLRGGQWGNVDNTGATVVTRKLRDAIDWCRTHQKTLYIPPGTYLVDQRIEVRCSSGGRNDDNSPHIHGDAYDRPVIKLRDGTFGGNPGPTNATGIFELRNERSERGAVWNYWSVISNVNFDLGNNPGAVAIKWASAQDSHLFNIKVFGKNFTAGFHGTPAANQANVNIEVEGGRYGLVLNRAGGGEVLTGIRLRGQSEAAIWVESVRGTTIVGLDYSGAGTAVRCRSNYNYEASHLYLQDAKLNITNSNRAAINANGRLVVLRNV